MSSNTGMQFPDTPYTSSFYADSGTMYRWQVVPLRQGHSFECVWRGNCARCDRIVWMARDGRWYEQLGRNQGHTYNHPEFGPILMCANCVGDRGYFQPFLDDMNRDGSLTSDKAKAGEYAPFVWKKIDAPTKKKEKVA